MICIELNSVCNYLVKEHKVQHSCIYEKVLYLKLFNTKYMTVVSFDRIGMISSVLCMIHCISTPFLFIAKACATSCCSDSPLWWQTVDYIFLAISLIAIYSVSKNSTITWLKASFWTSCFLLMILLINHSFQIVSLNSNLIFVPAFIIVVLHFYNLHFCNCSSKSCEN